MRPQLREQSAHLRQCGSREIQQDRRAPLTFRRVACERRRDRLRHQRRAEQLLRDGIVQLARDAMPLLEHRTSPSGLVEARVLDRDRQLIGDDPQCLGVVLVERRLSFDVHDPEHVGAEQDRNRQLGVCARDARRRHVAWIGGHVVHEHDLTTARRRPDETHAERNPMRARE